MKALLTIFIMILIIFFTPLNSVSQENQIYKHPYLTFQYEASKNWIKVEHPEDTLIYTMMSPDSNMHVMLWYTETEQNAKGYLTKMASMKNLIINDEEPFLKTINNHKMWILNVPGYEGKMSIQSLIAVIANGMPVVHSNENRLFIIQILCPKDYYPRYKAKFDDILNSVRIKD